MHICVAYYLRRLRRRKCFTSNEFFNGHGHVFYFTTMCHSHAFLFLSFCLAFISISYLVNSPKKILHWHNHKFLICFVTVDKYLFLKLMLECNKIVLLNCISLNLKLKWTRTVEKARRRCRQLLPSCYRRLP